MRTFRTLTADEIECRIDFKTSDKQGRYISLLLYKTARTDAALLDETFGAFGWRCDYKTIDGKMYCGISVWDSGKNEWVSKWNVGSESNMEAEKGEASDALKRAGFVWGLGAELYSSPKIRIFSDKCNIKDSGKGPVCYDSFSVKEIEYDASQNISKLVILNNTQRRVAFSWVSGQTEDVVPEPQQRTAPQKQETKNSGFTPKCKDCGKNLTDAEHDYSVKYYGKPLCRDCQKKNERIK